MPSKEDYAFYKSIGVCTTCRKKMAVPGKTDCEECAEKKRRYAARYYKENAEHLKEASKSRYQKRIGSGVCARCSKPATHGIYCYDCFLYQKRKTREKAERNRLKRHEKGLVSERRAMEGKCRFCENIAIPGMTICEEYREKMRKKKGKKEKERV